MELQISSYLETNSWMRNVLGFSVVKRKQEITAYGVYGREGKELKRSDVFSESLPRFSRVLGIDKRNQDDTGDKSEEHITLC